ncbi:hypothetical protein SUGI_0909060 [Cryptomeria japonica]|nr:hypothetical protein SUGI_0909060 [Cryptomeria japonica]
MGLTYYPSYLKRFLCIDTKKKNTRKIDVVVFVKKFISIKAICLGITNLASFLEGLIIGGLANISNTKESVSPLTTRAIAKASAVALGGHAMIFGVQLARDVHK